MTSSVHTRCFGTRSKSDPEGFGTASLPVVRPLESGTLYTKKVAAFARIARFRERGTEAGSATAGALSANASTGSWFLQEKNDSTLLSTEDDQIQLSVFDSASKLVSRKPQLAIRLFPGLPDAAGSDRRV